MILICSGSNSQPPVLADLHPHLWEQRPQAQLQVYSSSSLQCLGGNSPPSRVSCTQEGAWAKSIKLCLFPLPPLFALGRAPGHPEQKLQLCLVKIQVLFSEYEILLPFLKKQTNKQKNPQKPKTDWNPVLYPYYVHLPKRCPYLR